MASLGGRALDMYPDKRRFHFSMKKQILAYLPRSTFCSDAQTVDTHRTCLQ